MLRTLQRKNWVSDIQAAPLKYRNSLDRQRSIGYLAKYVAGTAIGDGRILSDENGWVTFQYHDYVTGTSKIKRMRGVEFHIAFRQHILPARLNRYRTSGLFAANRERDSRLHRCRALLGQADLPQVIPDTEMADTETADESDLVDSGSGVSCDACGAKMTAKYSLDGSNIGVMLQLVPLVITAIVVSTQLTIAGAINGAIALVVRESLRTADSNRSKNTLSAFMPRARQYNPSFHLTLRTLVVQAIRIRTSAKVPPRGPP
jgi:Putative transposase